MKKNAFTLIELIAVIVILGIILAIAVPTITGVIRDSSKNAFESDAKMVLKGVDYKKLENERFDPTTVNKNNIYELLGISDNNYDNVTVAVDQGTVVISIIGADKWAGFIACGTYHDMRVVENPSDCNVDSIPPVLTIIGNNPLNMYVGETYSDPGATAIDNISGNITNNVVITGSINPYIPGTYTITYRVKDIFENESVAMRTVNVIDNAYPMITFNPNENSTYAQTRSTTITATDLGLLDDGSLKYVWSTSTIEPSIEVFTNTYTSGDSIFTPVGVTGSYYLWAKASDTAGNRTVLSSGVFNLDNTAPVIEINGDTIVTVNKESAYIDQGAIATDNIDESVTVISTGSINPSVVGTYTITYNATDSSGNTAIPVIRTINVVDVQAPVITLNGSNPTNINVNSTYADAGSSAIDDVDGDVTSRIVVTGTVNPSVVGTYTITYTVKDNTNNTATLTRTVNVIDNIAPNVTFGTNGNATYAKSRSTTVTVSDAHTGVNTSSLKYIWNTSTAAPSEATFTTTFASGGTISTPSSVTGSYYLWILAKDNVGNTTITRTNVFNLDNTVPIITMNGSSSITINAGTSYTDQGATATDNIDRTISVTSSGIVNTNVVGTYIITYNATDSSGNTATPVTRTVTVVDVTSPTVAFGTNGNTTYAKTRSTIVTVSDTYGTVNTSSLKYLWNTSTTAPTEATFTTTFTNGAALSTPAGVTGGYYLWILAKDSSGNITITRTNVFNLDNTVPVITMNGSSPVTVNKGSTYTDAGATATDAHSGISGNVTTTSTVNTSIPGTYNVTYNVSDNAGNAATAVVRTINVIDVQAPVITLNGSNPVSIEYGSTYSDAGATATDDVDGNVTSRIITTSNVNPSVLGSYTVTYTVKDNANNTATSTRTANVVDTTPPTAPTISGGSTTYATSRTITITTLPVEVASGINRYEYYLTSSATLPTVGTAGTSNGLATSKVFNTNMAGYYVYFRAIDNVGNVGSWSSAQRLYIDINNPTITANSGSYTITQGASNALPGTYFSINQNGNATISSTTCVDTSNGNATVTNTSTLSVGTHAIKCTVTKVTGLSANATTNIVVNPAYTGVPNSTYTPGQAVSYAGVNWHVIRDKGDSVVLLADYGTIPTLMQHHNNYSSTWYSWFDSNIRTYLTTTWLNSNSVLVNDKNLGYLLPTTIGQFPGGTSGQYICDVGDQYYTSTCEQTYVTKSAEYVRIILQEEYATLKSNFTGLPYQNWLYKSYYSNGYNCSSGVSTGCNGSGGYAFGIWWTLSYYSSSTAPSVYAPYTLYAVCQAGNLSYNACWVSDNGYATTQAYFQFEVRPVIRVKKRP